ncbi:FliM/FliN family flagellar motor switch protein [Loktanella sp. R86503]|uniref:FliM/FliN family flagellar motor switch protein n=1 Tax=Loktanella sp. R86503 TaxID=3093847 RepID=UPI0036D8CD64
MTTATGSGVLRRMTQRQQPDAPDVPLTASRAVRLALARGAQTSIGLPLTVGSVAEQTLSLDELLSEFTDDLLLLSLKRDGAICGILACDAGLVAAAIEVMTTGKISAALPDARPVTRTEGTLVQPLLRALLDELEETTARTPLDGWTRMAGLGPRFDSCRAASFDMVEHTYRLMRMSLECGSPDRQGLVLLALPMQGASVAETETPTPAAPAADWHSRLHDTVMTAPARLDAVLHRMKLPLSVMSGLHVGQVLPLQGCTVGMVRLVDPNGRTVARGRLGQMAGQIAVRVQACADTIPMTEMDGGAVEPPERALRTRAGDIAAPQFAMNPAEATEDEIDWSAAPMSLSVSQ